MNRIVSPLLRFVDRIAPPAHVEAHCDIPCGIYDPHMAQIAALTVVRMNQLMNSVERPPMDAPPDAQRNALNSLSRYIKTKEDHAELCKRELDILWHDYFRPEHLEKYPELHTKFWNATKLASKNKQTADIQAAEDLLAATREIAEIFWDTKGVPTRVSGSNQTAGGQLVYVAN